MIGSFAVGKTSLVQQYVTGRFSEKYLSTVGVKIDRRVVRVDNTDVSLIIWDLAGEDELQPLRSSYLRGSAGYLLVADGTRRQTVEAAVRLQRVAEALTPGVPFILALNKVDLEDQWTVDPAVLTDLTGAGWEIERCSAKTGDSVASLFERLAYRAVGAVT